MARLSLGPAELILCYRVTRKLPGERTSSVAADGPIEMESTCMIKLTVMCLHFRACIPDSIWNVMPFCLYLFVFFLHDMNFKDL